VAVVNERDIEFYSGPGWRLSGRLYTPSSPPPPDGFPAIVLCLGFRPVFTMFAPKYAHGFGELGYAVLAFDYRGFGRSEGPRWRHIAQEQVEDIRNAVTFARTCPDIDLNRIAIWGDASMGGAHAVVAGALDERVRCVAATTPFADGEMLMRGTRTPWGWREFLREVEEDRQARVLTGQGRQVKPHEIMHYEASSAGRVAQYAKNHGELAEQVYPLSETADALMAYKPIEYVHKLSPRPLLLIAAELDDTTPAGHARLLYEAAGAPKRLVVLRGAHHTDVRGDRLPEVMELGAGWLDHHLAPATEDIVAAEGDDDPLGGTARNSALSKELVDRIRREAIH
jgi:uncharacterized protein